MVDSAVIVRVDEDFARFGSKSYAINKINSVEVRERKPYGMGATIICGALALILLLSSFNGGGVGSFVIGVVFVGLAFAAWQRAQTIEYLLFLMTSSSEAQAFVTRDESEVESLREQIEGAMLSHSRRGATV